MDDNLDNNQGEGNELPKFNSQTRDSSHKRSRRHASDHIDHRYEGDRKGNHNRERQHLNNRSHEAEQESIQSQSSSSDDSSEDDYRHRKKRKHKKERKDKKKSKKKKKDKKRHKKDHKYREVDSKPSHICTEMEDPLERNHMLAESLCNLFDHYPDFASELPIMLIRLGRGTTFDLGSMTNNDVAQRLQHVFQALSPFGVSSSAIDDKSGSSSMIWSWNNPAETSSKNASSSSNNNNRNELVLIRVVRALLDQIGITMAAIEEFEKPDQGHKEFQDRQLQSLLSLEPKTIAMNEIEEITVKVLETFQEGNLATELAEICTMIIDGDAINLDGLPDPKIKGVLESLLNVCGLEQSEMEVNDDDDDEIENGNTEPQLGYSLPESNPDISVEKLKNIINICQSRPSVGAACAATTNRRRVQGPMLPDTYPNDSSDDDDDGPLPVGVAAANRAKTLSKEQVKALAARRAYELACAKEGIDVDPTTSTNSIREEWMVVPGKYDFLSSIQTGRSRTFAGKSKSKTNAVGNDKPIDPKIQAEIQSIRDSYEATRGPSLIEQHREMKRKELEEQQQNPTAASWKWTRDKDLDAGRRVDKDALGMILGNAGTDLKNKFQSGI